MRTFSLWCLPVLAGSIAMLPVAAQQEDFRPHAFDWPQWQGPKRTGISRETGLRDFWRKGGPPLVWKSKHSGVGFVTPSVAAGRVFLMGNIGTDVQRRQGRVFTEYVICLSEKTGDLLWKTVVGPVRSDGGGYQGPRSTPTVDGDWLYALGINGDLLCLDVSDGKDRWRKDLRKDFGGNAGGWGYSESPLVDGNKLVVTPGGKKNTLVALDKNTGTLIWSAKVPEGDSAGYSSIIMAEVCGQREYIQFMSRGVVGIAAEDGKFLWRFNSPANGTANISTPLFHDNCVFAASAYNKGGALARLSRTNHRIGADEVYFTEDMQNHHGGMVFVDGYLYGSNGGNLCCLEFASGNVMWQSNKPGKGSITFADGFLYYRQENGRIFLIEANPRKYVQMGAFMQPDRSTRSAWAHPVIANGRMYIADQHVVLCYDVKKQ